MRRRSLDRGHTAVRRRISQGSGNEFTRVERAARFVLSKTKLRPRIAVVLGSGLGGFADELKHATRNAYEDIPNFPRSTAIGHAGRLVIGKFGDLPLAVMQGRVHLYEGYTAQQVAFPIRVLERMGIRAAVLTNAAGGINTDYKQGCLVVIRDHINLQGQNPLVGENDERFGPRFPDMTRAYWKAYREMALAEAGKLGLQTSEGIYGAVLGPSYETPAEIRYLRTVGADLVGMSTVSEVIAAAHMGVRVLAVSCVTNMAAGITDELISHEEVLATGERVQGEFVALLRAVLPKIDEDL